jgi:hypothetical protein
LGVGQATPPGRPHRVVRLDCLGLRGIGEQRAPLEPFARKDGGELAHERLMELAGAEEGKAVEETDLATLL